MTLLATSLSPIFRKIPIQYKFKFVHDYLVTPHFSDYEQKKIIILYLGKYNMYNKNVCRIVFNVFESLMDTDNDKQST